MCYMLRSCDAAFLWQHSTRCYSHFAVFSSTASYSLRLGPVKRANRPGPRKGSYGRIKGRLKSPMSAPDIVLYEYIFL